MQTKFRIEPGRKIEQLPDRDARLARIGFPGVDCVGHVFVEAEQSIFSRRQRGEAPKRFRPALDLARFAG